MMVSILLILCFRVWGARWVEVGNNEAIPEKYKNRAEIGTPVLHPGWLNTNENVLFGKSPWSGQLSNYR